MTDGKLGLFDAFGVEIEYMIVDAKRLDVLPICDQVIGEVAGEGECEVERDELEWSNELVLHVIELKTAEPVPALSGLAASFQRDVGEIEALLAPRGGRLMPTAMHPWMDPATETRLWPHEYGPVYKAFDRIFGCKGHGWSNLQSVHINLPFDGDDEFGRLHDAIRVVLPILPALAASSPIFGGRLSPCLDSRLDFYRGNARRVPSVSGAVIPESVASRDEYESRILRPMYHDIARHDPDGILQHEWLNARGAIARFDRGAIEIRLIDVQECPRADLAVAAAVVAVLRGLVEERWSSRAAQASLDTGELAGILSEAVRHGEGARVSSRAFLDVLGHAGEPPTAGELWAGLVVRTQSRSAEWEAPLELILERGTLASRICSRLGSAPDRARIVETYSELCDCLREGELFRPEAS